MNPAPKAPDQSTYSGRFAARLRSLREKAGVNVSDLVSAAGVSQSTYYNWEAGATTPPLNAMPALAKALGLKSTRVLFPEN